ncbi:MAG: hypothetical protein Q7K42_05240 [Candidatus Diapherotrites archaeon]|nr:hypothetical protein [Candidatus Diapherotrites archaeon]
MTKKVNITDLSIVQEYLRTLGGEDIITLIKICQQKKKKVKDEEIGQKMKNLKITEIRALLNKLHFKGISDYSKKRDGRSGWYNYTWEIKCNRLAALVKTEQEEALEKLEKRMGFEEEHEFFTCKKACDNLAFEIAAEYNFKCPKCGESMDVADKNKGLKKIKDNINKIKKEITLLTAHNN